MQPLHLVTLGVGLLLGVVLKAKFWPSLGSSVGL